MAVTKCDLLISTQSGTDQQSLGQRSLTAYFFDRQLTQLLYTVQARGRRNTAKVAERFEVDAPAEEQTASPVIEETKAEEIPAEEVKPAKKAPAKKKTASKKKADAPAEAEPVVEVPAEVPSPEAETVEVKKPRTRKPRTKKETAPTEE